MADVKQWITVHPNGKENKGQPIPVMEGQSKGEAVKSFVESKTGKEYRQNTSYNEIMGKRDTVTTQEKPTDKKTFKNGDKFLSKTYDINEDLARISQEATASSAYKKGRATEEYKRDVEKFDANVNALIEKYKNNDALTDDDWAKVYALANKYSQNRADFTNKYNRINSSYPSWFISGSSKYNSSKNDKRNNSIDKLFSEQGANINPDKNAYLENIESILSTSVIKSDDSNAVGKLQKKYDTLKAELENGKQMNAYFRKHKTLVGFPGVSETAAKLFDKQNKSGNFFARQPFASSRLSAGNAELRRIKERIDRLSNPKSEESPED